MDTDTVVYIGWERATQDIHQLYDTTSTSTASHEVEMVVIIR